MHSRSGESRRCLYFNICGKSETHNGIKWHEHWCKYKDEWMCKNHYNNLVSNPKQTPEYRKKYNSRITPEQRKIYDSRVTREQRKKYNINSQLKRIQYKNKRIYLDKNPRTGYCGWCNNNKFDDSCKRTHMHHIEYYAIFMWFGTIELCYSCHSKETRRLMKLTNLKTIEG